MREGREKRQRTEFGQRLYKARKHAKLTQTQLAKAAGLSQSTLAELEYDGNASGNTVQLASACGVRTEWLAKGVGPMVDTGSLSREIADLAAAIDAIQDEEARAFAMDGLRTAVRGASTRTANTIGATRGHDYRRHQEDGGR